MVRDISLEASGLLSSKMFGPPVRPPQPASVTETAYGGAGWEVSQGEDRYRRALYTFTKRSAPFAAANAFDTAQATLLAMAGLNRLGLTHLARGPIEVTQMLPAIAQGAIGVERRQADARAQEMLDAIHHGPTGLQLAAERALLARLDGSCQTPIAGLAVLQDGQIWLRGEILRPDGSRVIAQDIRGAQADGKALGAALADQLLGLAGPHFFG